jgi:flagellar biosynthesis repressor protein FlbT
MMIHLKKGEKLFINGAVIRLDRRGSIELLNDAQFLLETHIMQPEKATSPLRRLYFIVQTMIIDPANAHMTTELFLAQVRQICSHLRSPFYAEHLGSIEKLIRSEEFFEALKALRRLFKQEDEHIHRIQLAEHREKLSA